GFGTAKISVPAGPATLDLVLKPWATLRGRVVSVLGGGPVAGVKVFAANPEAGTTMTSQIESLVLGTTPTTDANGGFVVSRVTPGPGKVRFLPAKGGFTELAVHPYTVAEGQTLDLGTIKIIPPRDSDAGTLGMTTV